MDVCRHLRSGADGLETLCSQIYVSGENLMALAHHCESQSEANLIHNAMSQFGLPANLAPYHSVSTKKKRNKIVMLNLRNFSEREAGHS